MLAVDAGIADTQMEGCNTLHHPCVFNGSPQQLQGELAVPPLRLSCAPQLSSTLRWTPRLLNQMKAPSLLEQQLLPPNCAAIVRAG